MGSCCSQSMAIQNEANRQTVKKNSSSQQTKEQVLEDFLVFLFYFDFVFDYKIFASTVIDTEL